MHSLFLDFVAGSLGTPGRLKGEVWIADETKLNFFQDCQLFQEDAINSSSRKRKLDVESNKPDVVTQKVSLYVENLSFQVSFVEWN